ncbi:signal recognition particle protein [Tumebacillus sp. DT12]|uniref:Signal recognition particle protein n=1 Tax=Tumebacillus lacus TaxID=2995335 RepID=A0ABT3WV03_9BACL|nr:signal recognition particle protein [Tumebacillus lacus]MCX7568464.1 signal recognition particle protein [Tumebacillus lacus]
MVFESLANRLQDTFNRLRGKGKLSESDVKEAMREVRLALLEADVNFKVVKDFVEKVRERAIGQEVLQSLTPGQHVIKIVNDELTELMGGSQAKLNISNKPPTVIMMVGLQGAGKTTHTGKLAKLLQKEKKKPLLVACDIYRPAAIKQLQVLGEQLQVPVFSLGDQVSPVEIARKGLEHAISYGHDYVLIDTAGRLHIDETLMDELRNIKEAVQPSEILLVVDAMTGQVAVEVAETFNNTLDVTGTILTKLDGDTRGGAALSIRAVTGTPIKYVGTGEKIDAIEPFHPDRMASRILGMGDVLTLIEKAQASIDQDKAMDLERKMRNADFTLEDFLDQLSQVKNLGPLDQILGMLPGMNKVKGMQNMNVDDKQINRIEAIIQSMTPAERREPKLIDSSRRKRIAKGSGMTVQDVNRLLKQFEEMQKMMKQFSGMAKKMKGKKGKKGLGGMKFPFLP